MIFLPVTCLVLFHQGKLLAAQRSHAMDLAGSWEFPGGKLKEGEEPSAGLAREIQEELCIHIECLSALTPVEFSYPTKNIRLLPWLACWKSGELRPQEHAQVAWLDKEQLYSLSWAPADLPVVREVEGNWDQLIKEMGG
ncbi:MAG: (deoxy)nucleoside triphosphate pyrophosphohydrolase [Algoriphagus sp.]